jgi:hypothetical protein
MSNTLSKTDSQDIAPGILIFSDLLNLKLWNKSPSKKQGHIWPWLWHIGLKAAVSKLLSIACKPLFIVYGLLTSKLLSNVENHCPMKSYCLQDIVYCSGIVASHNASRLSYPSLDFLDYIRVMCTFKYNDCTVLSNLYNPFRINKLSGTNFLLSCHVHFGIDQTLTLLSCLMYSNSGLKSR